MINLHNNNNDSNNNDNDHYVSVNDVVTFHVINNAIFNIIFLIILFVYFVKVLSSMKKRQ